MDLYHMITLYVALTQKKVEPKRCLRGAILENGSFLSATLFFFFFLEGLNPDVALTCVTTTLLLFCVQGFLNKNPKFILIKKTLI